MVGVLDEYDEIDGFNNVSSSYDCQWRSECGHYLIQQTIDEGNCVGFDVAFNPNPKKDPTWANDDVGYTDINWVHYDHRLDAVLDYIETRKKRKNNGKPK